MPPVTIYTSPLCGYCHAAKTLLKRKDVSFVEHDLSRSPELRAEMIARANGKTSVPQIFIGDTHVGGCDELFGLERSGDLDRMLEA